ncbi:MAG TPA: hypothetical protein VEJ88_06490 [Dissulfurispiraceae bacterium]|nr:hypothetical protein [Dissulfurispiraceae bacterium]
MKDRQHKSEDSGLMFRFYFLFFVMLVVFCLLSSYIFAAGNEKKPALQFSRNQDISQIKPRKPVRIKLHRSAKGEYQWDITGDNADEIVKADRRLRKLLEGQ